MQPPRYDPLQLGALLGAALGQAGMSSRRLAHLAHINASQLTRWTTGQQPTFESMLRVATVLARNLPEGGGDTIPELFHAAGRYAPGEQMPALETALPGLVEENQDDAAVMSVWRLFSDPRTRVAPGLDPRDVALGMIRWYVAQRDGQQRAAGLSGFAALGH